MRDQQEQRSARRLLDQFEKRVGGVAIEFVGTVDDGDAPAAAAGRMLKDAHHGTHVVDADFRVELLHLLVPSAAQQRHVGMRQSSHLPRRGTGGIDLKCLRTQHARTLRVGVGQHESRDPPGESRLADALRSADDPGMRHAPRAIGIEERSLGRRVTDKAHRLARMRRVLEAVGFRHPGPLAFHARSFAGCFGGRVGPLASCERSRFSTSAQIESATSLSGASAFTTAHRSGSPSRFEKGFAQPGVKLDPLSFKPVGRSPVAAVRDAQETCLRRNIEKDREVGASIRDGDALQLQNEAAIELAQRTLIGAG